MTKLTLDPLDTYNVYLAGAISGISYDDATYWRNYLTDAVKHLSQMNILNPMEDKQQFKNESSISFLSDLNRGLDIFGDDLVAVDISHMVVINLLGDTVSRGTWFEYGYAYANNKPMIIITDDEQAYHPFILGAKTKKLSLIEVVGNVDDAISQLTLSYNQSIKQQEN